jgi:hypothetical protein
VRELVEQAISLYLEKNNPRSSRKGPVMGGARLLFTRRFPLGRDVQVNEVRQRPINQILNRDIHLLRVFDQYFVLRLPYALFGLYGFRMQDRI